MIRFLNVYYPTRTVLLLLCEVLLVAGCALVPALFLLGPDSYLALNYEYGYLKIGFLVTLTVALCYYLDLYEPQLLTSRFDVYFRILLALGIDCFVVSAIAWLYPEFAITEHLYVFTFLLLTPALLLWRRAYEWIVRRNVFRERIFVLGTGPYAQSIVESIRSRPELGMEIVAWEPAPADLPDRREHWIQIVHELMKSPIPPHRIIVAMEKARGELPVDSLLEARFRGITVEEAGSLGERLSGRIHTIGLRPSTLLYSEGFRVRPSQQLIRRLVSTLAAAIGLILLLPAIPFIVLLVRLSSKGPIFFRQVRVGLGGKPFEVIKFRTMFTDAEASGARWATKNDPRVTKIGMFMRKTRLDEVPQLWNVLRGDMGFVGPRPERPEFVPMLAEQVPFYSLRHLIRPGLTGWAQVRYGYGSTIEETRTKLEYDLYYVKHMSLGLDLLIMFETIKTILRRRGAQ